MASSRSSPALRHYLPALIACAAVVVVWLVVAVWVVFFGGPSSARKHRIDETVVPGLAVGGIALGDPRADVEDALGPSSDGRYATGLLWVHYDARGRVEAVSTRSPRLRTAQGIGVGSSPAQVRRFYPQVRCDTPRRCRLRTQGTTTVFLSCPDGLVHVVEVAQPGAQLEAPDCASASSKTA
jgi:hypothetical protein